MSAGGRTANRVEVAASDAPEPECACALCRQLAACLPDVRQVFLANARLVREAAELRQALNEERAEKLQLAQRLDELQRRLAAERQPSPRRRGRR